MTATAPERAQAEALTIEAGSTETGPTGEGEDLVLADLLVEEISIDGMCGVY